MSGIARISFCALLGSVLFVAGCSGKKHKTVKVSGRLTKGGAALKVPAMVGMVQLVFYPEPEGARPNDPVQAQLAAYYARADEDGNFTVPDGLPPGKYIIVVRHLESGPQGKDSLQDRFSFKNTKIVEEINEDRVLDIELDKYK